MDLSFPEQLLRVVFSTFRRHFFFFFENIVSIFCTKKLHGMKVIFFLLNK